MVCPSTVCPSNHKFSMVYIYVKTRIIKPSPSNSPMQTTHSPLAKKAKRARTFTEVSSLGEHVDRPKNISSFILFLATCDLLENISHNHCSCLKGISIHKFKVTSEELSIMTAFGEAAFAYILLRFAFVYINTCMFNTFISTDINSFMPLSRIIQSFSPFEIF